MSNIATLEKQVETDDTVEYPESDGLPMADNTEQFNWIVKIKEGLEIMFKDNPNVFVAGDLLWYPVKGNNSIKAAPDAMVVFNCPKGKRGSYKQWKEGGNPPKVVFEILSPGNTKSEMAKKFVFYEKYGVDEYYLYDPYKNYFAGWTKHGEKLVEIPYILGWESPALKIRFEFENNELVVYRPNGRKFENPIELDTRAEVNELLMLAERREKLTERREKEKAQKQAEMFAEKLKSLGIDPEEIFTSTLQKAEK
ncbi:MAG: Uma2 family endonuclease [Leptospiraceae bacterium]|nr:Uma2 family endonuclease [Leptospiraceae bacterium]MCP5493477.1 Uma2 family endonuclease [Leptospiraceae bacterium]